MACNSNLLFMQCLPASALFVSGYFLSNNNQEQENKTLSNCKLARHTSINLPKASRANVKVHYKYNTHSGPEISYPNKQQTLATSSANEKQLESDFVIIGYGSAGKAAHEKLTQLCPRASILVVDPFVTNTTNTQKSTKSINQAPIDLNTTMKRLTLSNGHEVRYTQSILIATGSRGAPPPSSLIDTVAKSRVLECQSTLLPSHIKLETSNESSMRPSLPPKVVREIATLAANQKASVCVLGSGLEALELAAALNHASRLSKNAKRQNGPSDNKIVLLFGSAAPLSKELPRYLSTAITKRLRQEGIDVYERRGVRYVSVASKNGSSTPSSLEVHIAKIADTMDTRLISVDLLIGKPLILSHLDNFI